MQNEEVSCPRAQLHLSILTISIEVKMLWTIVLYLLLSVTVAQESARSVELSLMENSIDDQFKNCVMKTSQKVIEDYFPREVLRSPFSEAWAQATANSAKCAPGLLERLQPRFTNLTINHIRAICVYTDEDPKVYPLLNLAMRTGRVDYGTPAFHYHALTFWLTDALLILRSSCQNTYRRTKEVFNGKKGDIMRFGHFASSSTNPNLGDIFGEESCFHIKTCHGAYIDDYTTSPGEREVLIPPFEKFKITDVKNGSHEELQCNKIFVLESAGVLSNLNCKVANHSQLIRADLLLILSLLVGLQFNLFPMLK